MRGVLRAEDLVRDAPCSMHFWKPRKGVKPRSVATTVVLRTSCADVSPTLELCSLLSSLLTILRHIIACCPASLAVESIASEHHAQHGAPFSCPASSRIKKRTFLTPNLGHN